MPSPEKQTTRFFYRSPDFARFFAAVISCFVVMIFAGDAFAAPVFADLKSPVESSGGYYTIAWKDEGAKGKTIYELAEFAAEDGKSFRVIYRGPDLATTLSGRRNGTYVYRIRAAGGEFATGAVTVRVNHHSLNQAFTFLGAGAIVFLATLFMIVMGARSADSENGEADG